MLNSILDGIGGCVEWVMTVPSAIGFFVFEFSLTLFKWLIEFMSQAPFELDVALPRDAPTSIIANIAGMLILYSPIWFILRKRKAKAEEPSGIESEDTSASLVEANYDGYLKKWYEWHTDLDKIVSYPAFHEVTKWEFSKNALESYISLQDGRKKYDKGNLTLDKFKSLVTKFGSAMDNAIRQSKKLGRSDALDESTRKIMDTADHLLKAMRRGDTDTDTYNMYAKKLYRLLEPVVGTNIKSAPELETVKILELEK